jgi:hypothetical protein
MANKSGKAAKVVPKPATKPIVSAIRGFWSSCARSLARIGDATATLIAVVRAISKNLIAGKIGILLKIS